MPYSNITHYPRPHNRETHPVIGHVRIEAARWSEFDRVVSDQTQAKVLGHDDLGGEFIVAHVACTSDAVLGRLRERWAA